MQSLQQPGTNLANIDMTWHGRLQLTWIQLYYLVHGDFIARWVLKCFGHQIGSAENSNIKGQCPWPHGPMAHHGPWHAVSNRVEVSMAICRAGAAAEEVPLYQPLAESTESRMEPLKLFLSRSETQRVSQSPRTLRYIAKLAGKPTDKFVMPAPSLAINSHAMPCIEVLCCLKWFRLP